MQERLSERPRLAIFCGWMSGVQPQGIKILHFDRVVELCRKQSAQGLGFLVTQEPSVSGDVNPRDHSKELLGIADARSLPVVIREKGLCIHPQSDSFLTTNIPDLVSSIRTCSISAKPGKLMSKSNVLGHVLSFLEYDSNGKDRSIPPPVNSKRQTNFARVACCCAHP